MYRCGIYVLMFPTAQTFYLRPKEGRDHLLVWWGARNGVNMEVLAKWCQCQRRWDDGMKTPLACHKLWWGHPQPITEPLLWSRGRASYLITCPFPFQITSQTPSGSWVLLGPRRQKLSSLRFGLCQNWHRKVITIGLARLYCTSTTVRSISREAGYFSPCLNPQSSRDKLQSNYPSLQVKSPSESVEMIS